MYFDAIIGHDRIKASLETAIASGHIGHAYIFEGPKGVGRQSMANAFAHAVTESRVEHHPDIITVTNQLYDPDKKQTNLLVDTIRGMKKDIYIKPYQADHKFYIVPRADTMNIEAQNSLLKVFEEPPGYCTIILITENANTFLQTILSRAALVRFQSLAPALVEDYLVRQGLDSAAAKLKAVMSGGSIGKALELMENEDADTLRSETIRHVSALCGSEYRNLYDFVKFLKANKAELKFILAVLSSWFVDVQRKKQFGAGTENFLVNVDKLDELNDFCGRVTREAAFAFLEITTKYEKVFDTNANYPVAVLCMAMEYWEEIHGRNYRSTI